MDEDCLHTLVQEHARPGMIVIELGTYTGSSAMAMLDTIKANNGHLHCVDWFKGNPGVDCLIASCAKDNVVGVLEANLAEGGYGDCTTIHVGRTDEAHPSFPDGMADIIFIDAEHTYSAIKRDLENWWPKLKPGGMMCGHDFEKQLDELDPNEVERNCEIDCVNVHHGVIRAVGERFGIVGKTGTIWWVVK